MEGQDVKQEGSYGERLSLQHSKTTDIEGQSAVVLYLGKTRLLGLLKEN